ncbi:Subtilisin-like protease SBT5.3 [Dichanthelium oligosanthes]|uniref:Subtilisin-like protease SBT5.3 n=1 Tax=Dichanthelium oligosanthes TaxID=888268 RepID=A0A1E5UP80_9POAL|nr:Subtilisin-like protease SBT5.3 [Dichanthelium oligosanthes]
MEAAGSMRPTTAAAAFLLVLLLSSLPQGPAALAASSSGKASYVVYLGGHPRRDGVSPEEASRRATDSHHDLLAAVLGDREKAREAIFYSYTKHINGFAATLEPGDAAEIAKYPGVVSVFPNRGRKLQTTRSWQFMGLERDGDVPPWSAWETARFNSVRIATDHVMLFFLAVDEGVWPESKSFDEGEMGPIPDDWKGICQNEHDTNFHCNSKLIGARYFNKGYAAAAGAPLDDGLKTPRDENGHGTHTLSTAGGAAVRGASAFGYGAGTARGGAPRARVAAYRVCFRPINGSECFDADVLAGFEAAIADGVHVISASVGGDATDYLDDAVAIGSLHAVKAGVTVVCSAGNSGPDPGTVTNTAPWILTVAASSIDREFPAFAVFNRTRIQGRSLSEMWLHGKGFYLIISGAEAMAPGSTQKDAQACLLGSLDPEKARGKIVVCVRGAITRVEKGEAVRRAGAAAMILVNDEISGNDLHADPHVLPAVHISYADGLTLSEYIKNTKIPSGFVIKGRTILGTRPAPVMADFSSQGPNTVNPEILKPDITAPGVSVIAAWTGAAAPTDRLFDRRRVAFNVLSGTSMSCPHVSGIAGLIKTLHPDWSPAAIKSAIMTSATELDAERKPILNSSHAAATPFSYGAGHVFPSRALDPGLVYDMTIVDYLDFLCALGYNATAMEIFNKGSFVCPNAAMGLQDLNYPSITAHGLHAGTTTMVRRRVKNVGLPGTYTAAVVKEPEGVQVSVTPAMLVFREAGEEKEFDVSFKVRDDPTPAPGYTFGAIVWSDGSHQVRSPLVVKIQGEE